MLTYLGLDVLDDEPDGSESRKDSQARDMTLIDSGLGKRTPEVSDLTSASKRTYKWPLLSYTDADALKDFIDARKGMLVPFWLPTYTRDLTLAATMLSYLPTAVITACGYTARFMQSSARRHLFVLNRTNGTVTMSHVINSVDNGNGTETLTFDANAGQSGTGALTLSFMRYCRLADDTVSIDWTAKGYGVATLPFIEIPSEAP